MLDASAPFVSPPRGGALLPRLSGPPLCAFGKQAWQGVVCRVFSSHGKQFAARLIDLVRESHL